MRIVIRRQVPVYINIISVSLPTCGRPYCINFRPWNKLVVHIDKAIVIGVVEGELFPIRNHSIVKEINH